jgi:hypothetical protein
LAEQNEELSLGERQLERIDEILDDILRSVEEIEENREKEILK